MAKVAIRETIGLTYRLSNSSSSVRSALWSAIPIAACELVIRFSGLWPLVLACLAVEAIIFAALATCVHKETLLGPTSFWDAVLYDGEWETTLLYLLDLTLIGLPLAVFYAVALGAAANGQSQMEELSEASLLGLLTVSVVGFTAMLAYMPVMFRLSLRLPSRAIGQTLRWSQAWRLGRGSTWRLALLLGGFLIAFAAVDLGLDFILPSNTDYATAMYMTFSTFFGAILLSASYAQLSEITLPIAGKQATQPAPEGP